MEQESNIPKTLIINNKSSVKIDETSLFYLTKIVLNEERGSDDYEVNLVLSDSGEILEMNKKYRGKNKRTDVLSFPSELSFLQILGDIIIDIEVANQQKGNRTLDEEVQFLYLHGLLHLLGYDHIAKKDKEIMDSKEIKYWNLFKGGKV